MTDVTCAGPPRAPPLYPGAGQDLAPKVLVGVVEPLDQRVRGAPALLDERGQASEVDALVLACLVEAGAALEAAERDREEPLGRGRQRLAAERGAQAQPRDLGPQRLELAIAPVARKLVRLVERRRIVEHARPQPGQR